MITNAVLGLVLGAVDLLGHDRTGPYYVETKAEGTDWGNPEQIVRAIETFLQDGAIQVVDGYNNRELVLEVLITGEDSYGLALGEAALFAECGIRNALTWTPPDIITGSGTPCVFDVVSSRLDRGALDDLAELRLERAYKLTVAALPFARSEDLTTVTIPAPTGVTPTVTSVDACTSTTNWASTYTGTGGVPTAIAVTGGTAIRGQVANPSSGVVYPYTETLTRTGLSVDTSVAQYLRIDIRTSLGGSPGSPVLTVRVNGNIVTPAASSGSVYWFLSPVATVTSVSIQVSTNMTGPAYLTLDVYDISRSTLPQDASGDRQTFRSLAVAGSARTQGNLALADPAAALGSVLVYTTPNVGSLQQPPLRAMRTAGSTETTDTSLVSGKYSDLATNHVFDIPAPNIPAGGYLLVARIKHASAATYTLTWAAKSRMGSTNDTGQAGTQAAILAAATWTIVPVARLVLPTRAMGSAGLVRIELSAPSGVLLDEAWLFNIDSGHLTIVDCGTGSPTAGGPANRVWLDAASLDNPVNSVWLGNASDRSDAYGAGAALSAMAEHEFVPPSMNVFTVTTNSVGTGGTLSFYSRHHTHVAEA